MFLSRRALALGLTLALLSEATVAPAAEPASPTALPTAAAAAPTGPATPAPPEARGFGRRAAAEAAEAPANLSFYNRRIVQFRTALLGDSPDERADRAAAALREAVRRQGPGLVTRTPVDEMLRFDLDGAPLFFLTPADLGEGSSAERLDAAALKVQRRLDEAVAAAREDAQPGRLALAAAIAIGATAAAAVLGRLLFALRSRGLRRLDEALARWRLDNASDPLAASTGPHTHSALRMVSAVLTWGAFLLLCELWAALVLRQFGWTRPWGDAAAHWLADLAHQFAVGFAGAVPGLATAALIFLLARWATLALGALMQWVEDGQVRLGWLDRDTARPTRRLGSFLVWLFAIAMAYPYLPGSGSEAFQGVSVLAGLMLSLGATGVVGQAMAGLGLMYSRSMRVGEHVRIGEIDGTVTAMGLFAVKLHTGLSEEVSLPNAFVAQQAIRNNSRLVADGRFVLQIAVTIGYGTPWRQVHALLLEAARRTPGVMADPAPYVLQTALSDFYVEYRLCAQADRSAPRLRAEALGALHAQVQDVFNENGVQIMSPHYLTDPPAPQVVRPGEWFPAQGPAVVPPGATAAERRVEARRDAA